MKKMTKLATASATFVSSLILSASASAITIPETETETETGTGQSFASLYQQAEGDGKCRVSRVKVGDSTLYIPSDPSNSSARFNVLVWGNGTGGTASTYISILESVASHCIAVAAANTENSGEGTEMASALRSLQSRYSDILASDPRICTAGHSQGGGGSFNAAPQVNADCVIPVQPDTRFTIRIKQKLDSDIEVITIWGSTDTLAPASGNRRNVENNSSILTQIETDGEGHFVPTTGRGGAVGTIFRMANIAQLSPDADTSKSFRGAFFGSTTNSTVTDNHRDLSDVRRDSGAESTAP